MLCERCHREEESWVDRLWRRPEPEPVRYEQPLLVLSKVRKLNEDWKCFEFIRWLVRAGRLSEWEPRGTGG